MRWTVYGTGHDGIAHWVAEEDVAEASSAAGMAESWYAVLEQARKAHIDVSQWADVIRLPLTACVWRDPDIVELKSMKELLEARANAAKTAW